MRISVDIDVEAVISTPEAEAIIARACEVAETQLAHEIKGRLLQRFQIVFRNPTPYYETQIDVQPSLGHTKVTDQGVIYGHWLEGDGSRNYPVTRFPGYHSFQLTTYVMQQQAKEIVERHIQPFVFQLGG